MERETTIKITREELVKQIYNFIRHGHLSIDVLCDLDPSILFVGFKGLNEYGNEALLQMYWDLRKRVPNFDVLKMLPSDKLSIT